MCGFVTALCEDCDLFPRPSASLVPLLPSPLRLGSYLLSFMTLRSVAKMGL